MNNKQRVCILFSGIDKLGGLTAIRLMKDFSLKEYGGVSIKSAGKFWYTDVSLEVNEEFNVLKTITELFVWLGMRKILFRFDKSSLQDSQVDFQLHIAKESTAYISIPRPQYMRR